MPDELLAITPIDGRYHDKVKELENYFSEFGLIKFRVFIEISYLCELSGKIIRSFNDEEKLLLDRILANFSIDDAKKIKEIEKVTNHDVKAVEYFLKEKLKETSLKDVLEMIHFGLTSYDVNDSALYLMLKNGIEQVYLPNLKQLIEKILEFSEKNKNLSILGRTHGQPASPTTFGKEFSIFALRLSREYKKLKEIEYYGKLNGAVGNYNALYLAYPTLNCVNFSENFLRKIGLKPNLITTQIESHDKFVEIFQILSRINNILLDFDQDSWMYISDNYLIQQTKKEEVGSSVMPHKVNPIDFENSEVNSNIANAMISGFSKLQISRLQRDLSDSTTTRNFGSVIAYCLLSVKSAIRGLGKVNPNEKVLREELEKNPEILSEAIQTILRKEKFEGAYEKLKELTRGKEISLQDLRNFINSLEINLEEKEKLLRLEPSTYIGKAIELTELAIKECKELIS